MEFNESMKHRWYIVDGGVGGCGVMCDDDEVPHGYFVFSELKRRVFQPVLNFIEEQKLAES